LEVTQKEDVDLLHSIIIFMVMISDIFMQSKNHSSGVSHPPNNNKSYIPGFKFKVKTQAEH
jgi:hypothetical protein